MEVCKEMQKLRDWLDEVGIEWEDWSQYNSEPNFWVCRTRFKYKDTIWSVINGCGSYGGIDDFLNGIGENKGLLEILDITNRYDYNEPIGYQTAEDIKEVIEYVQQM